MEQDMALATIQAQLAHLTSQLTHNAERTTMPSVPTFDVPYEQGYQTHQCPQFAANGDAWGYQGYDQPSGNLYFNARNSDWSDHSNSMWWEAQQVQHEAYWQPYEEFYTTPPQPPSQSAKLNSGTSVNNDNIIQLLISLNQEVENQTKEMGELNNQMGQIVEVKAQIQEQRELCNSAFANSMEEVEVDEAVTLEEEDEQDEPSNHSPNMDELLLQAEDEEDDLGSLDEFLSQTPQVPMSSNSGEEVLSSIHYNPILPNVLFPCRFLIPNNEESEKDIVEALPKAQEIEFDDTGQATTIIVNLAQFNVPEISKNVVFVIEFVSEKDIKPSSPILILIFTNIFLILMIQAPTREFKPLPNHFKYHLPLKDKFYALELMGV